MTNYLVIILSMVFVSNFVLARFLGLCPFIGVSKRTKDALGMGMAVVFVMTLASAVTWLIFNFGLKAGDSNLLYRLGWIGRYQSLVPVLKVTSYILVIATLVQLVEMFLRKMVPVLYKALGIYLPLITTNCAVMGVALLGTTDWPGAQPSRFLEAVVQGFGAGLGFTLAMLLMSGIRERLALAKVPGAFRDAPIAFVCTGMMALSFMAFQGMIR